MQILKSTWLVPLIFASSSIMAEENITQSEKIDELLKRVQHLEQTIQDKPQDSQVLAEKNNQLQKQIEILADRLDTQQSQSGSTQLHIGGYGEMHYNALDANGEDIRELDFHRMVLFFNYDFNNWARFVSELEVEHIIASGGSRGAVELEQVYVEIDLQPNLQLRTGAMLMPLGIINETHEPTSFYGVERPIIEQTIIPTTWWSAGMGVSHKLSNGFSYDILLTEGLKTPDPAAGANADPFDIKAGKQKGSFADAFDLALTSRVKYSGIPGIEIAAYMQYQPDLDQSAQDSYADSATLLGAHIIYQLNDVVFKALYARWDLAGEQALNAGKDLQDGGYIEIDWKAFPQVGFYTRYSRWSQHIEEENTQTEIGLNYYPLEQVVFKMSYQDQNLDAGNIDGLNLGFGYHF